MSAHVINFVASFFVCGEFLLRGSACWCLPLPQKLQRAELSAVSILLASLVCFRTGAARTCDRASVLRTRFLRSLYRAIRRWFGGGSVFVGGPGGGFLLDGLPHLIDCVCVCVRARLSCELPGAADATTAAGVTVS
ncbi:hypothetical protein ISCGN_030623 [Ixodes scapularis]